ncbi:MAG: AgmX/PglI C-terminal domain-containing protein [Persicimonas sp.]
MQIKPNVEKVARSARSRFSSCYSDALGSDPELKGKVMMEFNISTDGSVITPDVLVSDAPPVNSCFLGALSGLSFDPPSGGRCYVRLTYQLTP